MGRYSNNREPVGQTCPDINRVRDLIEASGDTQPTQADIQQAVDTLEALRASNSALRAWGTAEAERVDELEKELDELTIRCLQAERDRDDWEVEEARRTTELAEASLKIEALEEVLARVEMVAMRYQTANLNGKPE
jgi:chromosome segregation ATPase